MRLGEERRLIIVEPEPIQIEPDRPAEERERVPVPVRRRDDGQERRTER